MKILLLGPNSTKFYTHNMWAARRLEMQKLGAEGECECGVQDARGGGGGGIGGWNEMEGVSGVQGDAGVRVQRA